MTLIRPFRGVRPAPSRAAEVVGEPYPHFHVGQWRRRRVLRGCVLRRDAEPGYYAYRLEDDSHVQTGLVFAASLKAYRERRIRRHELTCTDKESDHVRHLKAAGAQIGPTLLVYPQARAADELLAAATAGPPETVVRDRAGVLHSIWPVVARGLVERLTRVFNALPALYIADGHHRSAAAERIDRERRYRPMASCHDDGQRGFLGAAFPHHAMRIMNYNRVVSDLNGHSDDTFLRRVQERFVVQPSPHAVHPDGRGEIGLYLPGQWFRLRLRDGQSTDPFSRLDVNVLTERLLGPILGIEDLRRDRRVEFVGGDRGCDHLEGRVLRGMAAAFVLYPTSIEELMAAADRGLMMPPKSTWFAPKLADGLVSYLFE